MGETLKQLIGRMRACTLCEGLPLGPKPLFQLDTSARILIAGQAPGRVTHAKGIPFDDVSGDRLRDWLGIDRDAFYDVSKVAILPMGLCFPGTGTSGDLPPRLECAPAWRTRVLDRLKDMELTLIIGRYAIDWHFPEFRRLSVTNCAEKWTEMLPNAIVLPHPSPRNNRWLAKNPWFEAETIPALRAQVRNILK